jgi:hypothetical protein
VVVEHPDKMEHPTPEGVAAEENLVALVLLLSGIFQPNQPNLYLYSRR